MIIELPASGNAVADTAMLQSIVDTAPDFAIIDLCNTEFAIKTAEPNDAFWYYASQPGSPVYAGIKLTRSNITIRNGRFRHEQPDTPYVEGNRPSLFATDINLQRGTLHNLFFENLTFDFKDTVKFPLVSAFYLVGVHRVRLVRNRYFTSGTAHEVTIQPNDSDQLTANWTAHGYTEPATVRFSGELLPPEIEADKDYFIRDAGVDLNAFRISEEMDGPVVAMESGTYTGTAYATQILGRCLTVDNCDDVLDDHSDYDHIRQGLFTSCNRDVVFDTPKFNCFAEGVDVDPGLIRGKFINPSFTNSFREGQGLDLGSIQDVQITGVTSDRVTQTYQIYVKAHNGEDYATLHRTRREWPCEFTLGAPGIITSVASDGLVPPLLVPCPIKEDERFWIDDSAGTFPVGVEKFTTYRAKNVDTGEGTFEFYADTDGTKASIVLSGDPPSDTFELRIIAETADMTVCKNIIVDNVTITNSLGTDNDIMISAERRERAGDDRGQFFRGVGIFVQDITLTNHNIINGKRFLVNEAENLTIQGFKLVDCAPGTSETTGASLVLRQSSNDTDAIAHSLLSGTVDGVSIYNSRGMGLYVSYPESLSLDKILVDGYNLQAGNDTAFGVRVFRAVTRGGTKEFFKITSLNGVDGSSVDATDLRIVNGSGAGFVKMLGPFDLRSAIPFDTSDLGTAVINMMTAIILAQAVGATTIRIPLVTDPLRKGRIFGASIQNLDAIAGNATNYSKVRLRKMAPNGIGGATLSNLTGEKDIDNAAVNAATSRDMVVSPSNAAANIDVGEYLFVELTRAGTGSTIPNLMFNYSYVPLT